MLMFCLLSSFHEVQGASPQNGAAHRVGPPTSSNISKIILDRCAQQVLSQESLDPIKRTMNTSYHKQFVTNELQKLKDSCGQSGKALRDYYKVLDLQVE